MVLCLKKTMNKLQQKYPRERGLSTIAPYITTVMLLLFFQSPIRGLSDPFSKISITSQTATCHKNADDPSLIDLIYHTNVTVTFADNSTITAQTLRILVKKSSLSSTPTVKNDIASHVKSIEFDTDVHVHRPLEVVSADHGEIVVSNNVCKLTGNVRVAHTKKDDKDVPVTVAGDQATIDWVNGNIELVGTATQPVRTSIDLTSNMQVLQAKHEEKIKQRKIEKQSRRNKKKYLKKNFL